MMFSTHYHELTTLDKKLKHLKNVHVSAYEEDGKITFLHKIKEGSVDKSYGIHVARLAELPNKLINRADEILTHYEKKETKKNRKEVVQESLVFDSEPSVIEEEIKNLDLLNMTPLDALNTLYKLKEKL